MICQEEVLRPSRERDTVNVLRARNSQSMDLRVRSAVTKVSL